MKVHAEPLASAAQARAADAHTIEDLGVPGIVLMEHAGRSVAEAARRLVLGLERALLFAGPGNNGGDGWVAARHLWGSGVPCPVVTLKAPDQLAGDAGLAAQMFLATAEAHGWRSSALGGAFLLVDLADDVDALIAAAAPGMLIDALFGTGLTRAVEGVAANVIAALSRATVPVLAVDVPSGLPTDGQAPLGPAVRAAHTVTFGQRRVAHASEPGLFHSGHTTVVDIGLLSPPGASVPAALRLVEAQALVPPLDKAAHKGRFGHVGVVEGEPERAGAAHLAARAALRAGCGLCTLVVEGAPSRSPAPELMVRGGASAAEIAAAFDAVVLGPGLGARAARARPLIEACAAVGTPMVVDAEALDALAAGAPRELRAVCTPHPGEAGRLLSTSAASVQGDRLAAARALVERLGSVVVLKGACPVIAAPGVTPYVVEGGAPALAVAGSGDVLAGVIGALLGRGLAPLDAALVGVQAQQRAGLRLATRGALASDIADAVAHVLGRPA
ncbi:MAG: NAD(P)H-hydrate dehydratase [Deltaproteobacteria bacterium]|nr:NAD(P)H-hydrate dehydratase [Deltaproteobacteria bacterium]